MKRTDEEIKNDIVDQLVWDSRVDASDVTVSVTNGVVSLGGTVPDYPSLKVTEATARRTEGVVLVENEIALDPAVLRPSDDEIRATVMRTLHELCRLGPDRLSVSVEGGRVTLEGTVQTLWIRERAGQLTSLVSGVTGIANRLVIVPTDDFGDAAVAQAVRNALERKLGTVSHGVTVQVENGRVKLKGGVSNWHEREMVNEAAMSTKGVNKVQDELTLT
jgi:osmotically-inducible protein OsmY